MIALLLFIVFSLTSSQPNYVCGVEGYQFFSEVPCTNYPPTCANGGFKLFVGCQNDFACALHSPSAVCIDQCCCTPPMAANAQYSTLFRDSSVTLSLVPSILAIAIVLLMMN